jgi:hypothetical protein
MRIALALAGLSAAALLCACAPDPRSDADEKAMRAEPPAVVAKDEEKEMPVFDAQGNELEPELADAVREKMEEERAAQGDGQQADAPANEGGET